MTYGLITHQNQEAGNWEKPFFASDMKYSG